MVLVMVHYSGTVSEHEDFQSIFKMEDSPPLVFGNLGQLRVPICELANPFPDRVNVVFDFQTFVRAEPRP